MVSDCPLTKDCEGRLTGYLKEDEGELLLIAYKATDGESTYSLDLSEFLKGNKHSYIIKDEKGNTVKEGTVENVCDLSFAGEADKLYMIELK